MPFISPQKMKKNIAHLYKRWVSFQQRKELKLTWIQLFMGRTWISEMNVTSFWREFPNWYWLNNLVCFSHNLCAHLWSGDSCGVMNHPKKASQFNQKFDYQLCWANLTPSFVIILFVNKREKVCLDHNKKSNRFCVISLSGLFY